jgi:hypothetical protein
MKQTRTEYLGSTGVDSGQLLLTDPGYIDDESTFDYEKMCEYSGNSKILINKHGAEVGVVMTTQVGDGVFPVYARYDKKGDLLKIEILINQEKID